MNFPTEHIIFGKPQSSHPHVPPCACASAGLPYNLTLPNEPTHLAVSARTRILGCTHLRGASHLGGISFGNAACAAGSPRTRGPAHRRPRHDPALRAWHTLSDKSMLHDNKLQSFPFRAKLVSKANMAFSSDILR